MQNNDNTRKLYDALVADNYELGDYEKFTSDISNPEYMRKLYDTMVADDYELGEYNTFSSRYSVTPQGNAAQATQATARTAQPVVDAYGMPVQPEVSTIEDAPKMEEKPQENLKSDMFKPQSTETPSLLDMGAQPKDYFAEAGAKAMEGIRQERQAREYQEIMKPLSGFEGREQKKVLEERKRQIESQLNQPSAVHNAAARTNMAKALENVDKELQVLNEQQKQWQEQYGSWTPSSARRFREQTMEQTWYDPYAVVPEEYKALATQKWGKEGSEDAYFSAWMNISPEERETFVKREHIKSFFNEETASRMQGIRERATTYAQNALSEPVVSVDPRHSASAMAARTVSNIGVQTTKALDKAEEIKQAYKNHQLDENFFAGAYKGMKDGLTDIDNWTGLYMVGEMTNLYDIADKMEKGEELTQTEEDFLDAQAYKLAVEAALADDLGWGYGSGNVTGASVPFMLQMLASPMSGASGKAIDKGFAAVGRRAIDKFGKGILKKLLTKAPVKKVAKGLVGTVGKGIGQTILFGSDRVAAGTMERHLGNEMVAERANEEFNAGVQAKAGEDLGTAFFKAGVSASMENISEFAGGAFIDDFTKMVGKKISKEFMDAMGGSVGRRMANAAARQNANKVFHAIANNKWGQHAVKLSKSVQSGMEWDGLLNEYLEEVLNNASNVMIGDMSMEDFTSLEKNAETLLGLAWTSGFFTASNAASRIGGYARGNIALKRTDRAARQIFTGDMQEKWDAYTQALSQADGYEEVEQLYKGLVADISKNQDKELARAQMSEAAAYMTNYVKMMGMNAATEEADEEEQKTPAQKDIETAQGEGIAAQGTEGEMDVVEEMDESYSQLAGHLEGTNVEDWLLQYGETAAKQLEAIRGSELDEQTKAMAEAYLTSAQRYEGLLLANQEEVDAIVDEAAKEFDANVNQDLGSVIQVLTTQGKTAYVIQGNPNERENIRLRYEDGTTEPVSHTAIEKVLSQADANTMRSDMIEGVRKSAVAEVVQRMQGVVPNATQMQMPVGHNVVVDGQAGVVAGVNADGTMQIQMQGGNVVNAAPQQVMDAQAYNTIMERKARARESARVSVPVREEVATPVVEETTAAEAVAEEAIAAEEELTEAQKLLQEYMDESISLEDRQAIVGNNVARAKQAAVEAQAEVDAMTESKPKATDYTSIAVFKQAQEQWKAQMQEKQQALDLARQQEATWSEVQKGMVQPVKTATEQTSTKAVNEYMVSDEVDENGRAFVYSPNGSIEFGVIGADTGLTPAPILLSEGMITNPSTNDGYGLVHIEARHGDQIRAAGYKSVIEFVNEVAKNYEVIREGRDRNGHQTYMLQLTDKHNNTLMVELSGDGTYWNINTAGIFKTSYGRNRKEVYHRHTTEKQSTETAGVSQGIEQSGTQMPSSMNTPTSSASKDTQSVSTKQTDKEEISGKSAESKVEVAKAEAKNHNSKHDIKALAKEIGVSAKRIQRVIDFANQVGVKLNFANVTRTQGGKGAFTNADNMASKREITLSKYQLAKGMAIEWVMGHELTHQIKADGNAANWEAYKQAIINALGQDAFDKRVKEQSKVYREAGAYQDMSANEFVETMQEEVCADAAGDMLLNPDNMNKVMGVPQSLASRIWNSLKNMVTLGLPTKTTQAISAWQKLAEGKELTGEADGRKRHSITNKNNRFNEHTNEEKIVSLQTKTREYEHDQVARLSGEGDAISTLHRTTSPYSGTDNRAAEKARPRGWQKESLLGSLIRRAKEDETWIKDIRPLVGRFISSAGEHEVFFSRKGDTVIKLNDFEYLPENSTDFTSFINRIESFNELFPDVAVTVVGYTYNSEGKVSVVLEQPVVDAEREATEAEIDAFMEDHDFYMDMSGEYTDGRYVVYDLKPNNVYVDKSGSLRFFDALVFDESRAGTMLTIPHDIKKRKKFVAPYQEDPTAEPRYSLVGTTGARALDKAEGTTVRMDNMDVAEEMEAAGKDAETIWLATGWERGADGKWKYEVLEDFAYEEPMAKAERLQEEYQQVQNEKENIYRYLNRFPARGLTEQQKAIKKEQNARLKKLIKKSEQLQDEIIESNFDTTLGELIGTDNNIIRAYPELASMPVSFVASSRFMDAGLKGAFDGEGIWINPTLENTAPTLLHEVQHAIQRIEGFARGGNTGSVKTKADALRKDVRPLHEMMLDTPEWAERQRLQNRWFDETDAAEIAKIEQRVNEINGSGVLDAIQSKRKQLQEKYGSDATVGKILGSPYAEDAEIWQQLPESFNDKYEAYRNLAGEAEARNVSARLNMSEEERRQTRPGKTEDVAREEQTVIYAEVSDKDGAQLEETASATRYSIVVDPQLIAELEASPKRKGYRNVVQREDGLFEAPMGNSLRGNGITVENTPFAMGQWEQSEEHPELVYGDNKITLVKPDGKTVADVNYNPYIHNRLNTLNAQFKQAWERPDLVYIETEVPETDLEGGYMAEHAHLSTGVHQWSNGALMLSRYDKPVRIVPWDEVAIPWIEKYKKSGVHFDIVPPALRPVLAEAGVEIKTPHNGMGENCIKAYEEWKAEQEVRYSVTPEERMEMEARILDWLSEENLTKAAGMTREQIFEEFGNQLEPIAYLPMASVRYVGNNLADERIYSGKGYFIDHALRNHAKEGKQTAVEDIDVSKYLNIQNVLDNPDSIKETFVDGKRTVIFIKKIGRYFAELTQVEENGKIVLHKSFFNQKKEPYAKLADIRSISSSLGGGVSPISHADDAAPAISLQSRNDDELSASKDTQSVSTEQTDKKEISEKSAESNVEVTNEEVASLPKNEGEQALFSISAEEQGIVDAAKADGTYMKAPNGEPTNLTEKQWAQVRTKAFKEWFGDWENDPENASKIVDENGEPMVVYHGGTFGIKDFVPNGAMHFGSKVAAMERVLDTEWGKDNYAIKETSVGEYIWEYTDPDDADYDRSSGRTFASYEDALKDAVDSIDGVRIGQYYINAKNPMRVEDKDNAWEDAISIAQKTGADAIVYENQFEDIGSDSYIVFFPNQIKSATDNVGTFDAENRDIRYSINNNNVAGHIYSMDETRAWMWAVKNSPRGVLAKGYGYIDKDRLEEFKDWYDSYLEWAADEYVQALIELKAKATKKAQEYIDEVITKVEKHKDDFRRLAEGDDSVLSLENNARFSITPDILAANERFNEELDEYIKKGTKANFVFHIGQPLGVMKLFFPELPIVMRPRVINKASNTKHDVDAASLYNLPQYIAEPIFVFQREDGAIGILTEMMDNNGKNVCVAVELNKKIQDGGTYLNVNDIRSIHGRDVKNIVLPIIHNNTLKYADKKKALDWFSSASSIYQQEITNQELSDATKIVQDFQNPPLPVDESSQNDANAKSGEQKYSLPARPATPKRNEGEGIMEYAQRVANATEAQKAWDVANKTATNIDRQIKNSEEYRDILAQKEPQTIEEAASVALSGGKLLWNDHVDGTKVSKGAKSMMGWGEGERQRFFAMFASKENGGVSVEQMGEEVIEICSEYNIPVDETDAMAGTNAVLEVMQSAQRPSDITGYIEHNRIEQVRRMIEEEQELLASERNRAYMDMYGMTYDDFVEIASTIDAEDEQERSDDKNVIAWLYGQSQRQQERITNAQTELEQLKMNGVPKTQYDAAYRALEQMKAKVKRTQEKLDEATKELRTAKGQATRLKKANMRYKAGKGQWKQVFQELRKAINGKNIRSIDKSTLNEIMRASAGRSGMARLFGEAGMVEDIILGVNMRATQDRIDKLLATKTTALNDKGIATGKSVDASVQAILANIRKTLEGILHHDIENQIHELRSQNWHIRHNAVGNLSQEQQEQVDANKAKIEELKAELGRELATSTAITEQAVNEQIEKLTEQIDKKIRTEEESAELMTTLALKRQMVAIHTSYQDTAPVEALLRGKKSELRKLERTNWVALHDGNTPQDKREEYRQKIKALQEQIAGLGAQVREGRRATLDAMQSFADSLEETITTGRANLKGKMQEQLQRRKEFVAKAIHDVNASGKQMQSVNEADKQENDKLPWYKRMFSPALRTFDYMLQKVATRTYGKDSWLYRQFMLGENGVMAAHDEYLRGMQTAARTLEDKAMEIFGKSYQDVMAESNKKKDIGIEILRDAEDYEPSYIPLKLTKGQATYIYMLWRMRDGYSKLATQGFTEEIMQRIEEYIGPDYIQWADWVQMEYLPMMREKYNARYREIYDTNMAAIDNYVPIRIHGQAIRKEVDLTDATASMPGMQKKNGALIQRTVNVNPIDISNNIFELIGQHIDEMEEFYAYAPVRRDLQYILSSPAFRNLLNTQEPGTFQSLLEAARIATKTNQQPESAASKAFNDILNKLQKGLVSGNIAYRNMTAIKQVLSAPAFIGYSQSPVYLSILAKNMLGGYLRNLPTMAFPLILGIGHWAQKMTVEETAKGMPYIDKYLGETFRWCMREFPDFRERVTRGSAGDIRLEEKGFSKLLDKYTELGMSANVFIDAVTVSVGLKSIYDYEMAKAAKRISKMAEEMQMDEQWTEEEMRKASNAAKIQATLFANQTQQSSNPALLSPMQVSKNFMERSLTLYKNSSLGLMRAGIGGMRDVSRYTKDQLRYMKDQLLHKKGKKARRRMIEEYTRMFMQEGFAENEAKKRAISYVNSEARKGAFVALLEGYVMNVIWNLGSKGLLGFMAGGGDDDDKERTIGEWIWDGVKHVIKNTFGSAMPFVNDALDGRLPVIGLTTSEAEKAWKDIKKQLDENGISLAFALTGMRYAAKFGGVDMQVWANTMDGYYRLFSETGNSDDNILALMLILNSPHSNRITVARELYKGKSEEEFQRAIELAGRYNQPVWTFGREMTDKVESDMAKWYLSDNATDEEKQRMRYIEEMEERIDNLETVEDALEMFDEVSDTELRKKISSKIDQISKPEDTFAEKVARKKENALAEDDTDMGGYTYMKMADSQDLLEEKRMRAEIDMLRPIVERQKDLFEEYGSNSAVYTRFMSEHGAEIRRYNTLKAYSRAIQMRKRKMDEEGADVQALYEDIKELYKDAQNI